jgi:SPP1 gp7 family putative phage head morphogenesis protein
VSDVAVRSVPFEEAIAFLRDKAPLPTRTWTDLWEGMHARAFVVAGAMRDELLTDFQQTLTRALQDGTTLQQFRKDFEAIVARHGWTGWTGEGSAGGRAWRARVIYDTNLRMAHAAGRWEQIQRTKAARPYLRYSAVMDSRTRPQHRAWHGTILPADHPWWQTHYPPNGWYCRCSVIQLSDRDLERRGWSVSEEAPPSPLIVHDIPGRGLIRVPQGIDPGFASNMGEAAWGNQIADEVMARWKAQGASAWEVLTPGDWRSAGRPELVPVDDVTTSLAEGATTKDAMQRLVERVIGGREATFVMPNGSRVLVDAERFGQHIALDRAPFIPMLPGLLTTPYEVWMTFERHRGTGQVVLRQRVLQVVRLKNRSLVLVVQVRRGVFEAWTFVPTSSESQLQRWRVGELVWGR